MKLALKYLILIFALVSCSANLESPVVYISNASQQKIGDIRCNWAEKHNLSLSSLGPGESRSQSFYIDGKSDFFGRVNISWRNSRGENLVREFIFKENNLPSIDDHTTYNYVQLYLDQEEMEIVSSDAPDLVGKTRKMERLLTKYRDEYKRENSTRETSLIRVEDTTKRDIDKTVPAWLQNSY
ncbi:MAG: hypothetical protein FJ368_00265 [Pelagibacterales bacterium]|nr:hypothetical protein [Pelagibacterales bacterium]